MSISANPTIGDFVLYSERSIRLKKRTRIYGAAAIGIRSIAKLEAKSDAYQLTIGDESEIEYSPQTVIYSPSISLGRSVALGGSRLLTNGIEDNGITIGPVFPFPVQTMPSLPLAPAQPCQDSALIVPAGDIVLLRPGTYGRILVLGRLDLVPGEYSFCNVLIGDKGQIRATSILMPSRDNKDAAIIGHATEITLVNVRQYINTGRCAVVAPTDGHPPSHLQLVVAGSDTFGRPAVSFGEESELRAILIGPHGTVALADRVRATGAFAAFDLQLGEEVEVHFVAGLAEVNAVQSGSQQLSGYFGVNPNPNVAPVAGPVPADTSVDLTIGLPVQNPSALKAFIANVSNPKSPQFRKHLSQGQFASTYGAPSQDYQTLQNWATSKGFTVKVTYPTNLLLRVTGTAETVQRALYCNLVFRHRSDDSLFLAVDREPSLDLSVSILQIGGLTDSTVPRSSGQFGTGSAAAYKAADLRNAYLGVNSPNQALDGAGQVVGILGLDTVQMADINSYWYNQVPASGQQPLDQPPDVHIQDSSGDVGMEGTGDVELVLAMAPNARVVFFHGSTGITGHADDALHAMANYSPALTVASCSWTFGRSDNSRQAIDQLAAQGVTFFVASGDFGDIGDPQGNLDMNNQVLVGGTILNTHRLISPPPNAVYPAQFYAYEQTWNTATKPQQKQVTGGGIMDGNNKAGDPWGQFIGIGSLSGPSNCFCWPYPFCCGSGVSIPDYQVAVMQSEGGSTGGSLIHRNYPDVAMVAANVEIFFNLSTQWFGGTSAAAPLWAGYMALVNQNSLANGQGLGGFLNPTLYAIGLTRGTAVDLFSLCFNNVHDGVSNFDGFGPGFTSVPGYNLCTGWGSPTPAMLSQLSTLQPLTPNQPLVEITIEVTTGDDNAGDGQNGSEQSITIFLRDGGSFTLTLRIASQPHWENWTTQNIPFSIPSHDDAGKPIPPLTPIAGIKGAQLNHTQSNPDIAADNWDVFALAVTLSTPGFPAVRQIALLGNSKLQDGSTGVVRLSKNADNKGSGPHSPVYAPMPVPPVGTALTQIQFLVTTGNDNLGDHPCTATATVFVSAGHSFTVTLRNSGDAKWDNWTTNTVVAPIPTTDDQGSPIPALTPQNGITGVQLHLNQNNPAIAAENWDVFALETLLLSADSSVQVPQMFLVGRSTLQDGHPGLVRLSLNADNSGSGPSSQVFLPN